MEPEELEEERLIAYLADRLGKPVHKAKHVNQWGGISPLCAPEPIELDMRTNYWTTHDEFVTCDECKEATP